VHPEAAVFVNALQTCAQAGRRLPDPGELALVYDHLEAHQQGEWVAGFFFTADLSGQGLVMAQDDSRRIVIGFIANSTQYSAAYRCVTTASVGVPDA